MNCCPAAFVLCVLLYFRLSDCNNVETRLFHVIRPSLSKTSTGYGASSAITKTSPMTSLYIGAPLFNATPGEVPNGALYRCALDGTRNGTTVCDQRVTAKSGALGMSVDLIRNSEDVMACAPQYSEGCTSLGQAPWMMGACYKAGLHGATEMSNPCREESVCPSKTLKVDMIFVMDHSGSVYISPFKQALKWVNDVFANFRSEIENGSVIAGVVPYGSTASVDIPLVKRSYSSLTSKVTAIVYRGGGTSTDLGIEKAVEEFEDKGRPGVPRLMVVITDGVSRSRKNTTVAANNARAKNIIMVAVGVGGYNLYELGIIAGGVTSHVLTVSDFGSLGTVLSTLTDVISQSAQVQLEGSRSNVTSEFVNCQYGISLGASQGGIPLVGAVGSFDRAGSFAKYGKLPGDLPEVLNLTALETIMWPENITQLREAYLGYSVTSGKFLRNGTAFIASGSPRYHSKGQVIILPTDQVKHPTSSYYSLHPNGADWQLGAYYGHSVVAVDLNNDTFDDLLVSSPLYCDVKGFDQGRVFVYMNDPKNPGPQKWALPNYVPLNLTGSGASGARFGFSVTPAGDLDRNGFHDVIIGAPRELTTPSSGGCIYVYYSSAFGLSESHKQRVLGSSVTSGLVQFGYDVTKGGSGGYDVDGNSYPDLLVSAPGSDVIVALRSRPIVDVTSSVTFRTPSIDVIACLNDVTKACGSFEVCVTAKRRVDGGSPAPRYELKTSVDVDSLVTTLTSKRLTFYGNETSSRVEQVGEAPTCRLFDIRLNPSAFKKASSLDLPVRITYSYDFTTSHKDTPLSAVMDQFTSSHAHADWPINTGCSGGNGTCIHDLTMSVTYSIPQSNTPYVIKGSESFLRIDVAIGNSGPDHSILIAININSSGVLLTQVTGSCAVLSLDESTPEYSVIEIKSHGSVILNKGTCTFGMIFSLEKMKRTASINKMSVRGEVTSRSSNSKDPSTANNLFLYKSSVLYDVNLIMSGLSSRDLEVFNHTSKETLIRTTSDRVLGTPLIHTHTIYNRGANLLSSGWFEFTWPKLTKGGYPLLYLQDFECKPLKNCRCQIGKATNRLGIPQNATDFSYKISYPSPSQAVVPASVTCDTVVCGSVMCDVFNQSQHETIKVEATFRIWFPTLSQPKLNVIFSSNILLNTSNSPISPTNAKRTSTVSTAVRTFVPTDPNANQPEGLNIGAIIGGIIGGLGLMGIVILILWKSGFFTSKYKDLIKAAQEAEDSGKAEPLYVNNAQPPVELDD